MAESSELGRRQFVKVVLGAIGALMTAVIGLPAVGYIIAPAAKKQEGEAWIPLGPLENYPIGKPTLFNFTRSKVNGWEKTVNSYGAYVVRYTADEYKVFSNTCTHLSCRVNWQEDAANFHCPCHDGIFDIQGRVGGGPPPRPLDEYETKLEDGNLLIRFVEA